jgi:putative hemolysin
MLAFTASSVYLAVTASAIIAVLLYLSNRISGAETAITAISSVEVANLVSKGERGADLVVALKSDLDDTIITLLIANIILNTAIASLTTVVAEHLFGSIWMSVIVGIVTFIILIFGEITPKAYAVDNRVKLSLRNARWLSGLTMALGPLVDALSWAARKLLKWAGMSDSERVHLLVSDESIRQLAALGLEQGTVHSVEHRIISKVLDFADAKVRDLMVPRDRVFTVASGTPLRDAKRILAERGFTRVPVVRPIPAGADPMTCGGEVAGVVHVKDLLGKPGDVIDDFVRPPYLVSPMKEATQLFEEMRHKRVHMALICGDGGQLMGIITLEDLIEKVMGEIHDESHDRQFPQGEPP